MPLAPNGMPEAFQPVPVRSSRLPKRLRKTRADDRSYPRCR